MTRKSAGMVVHLNDYIDRPIGQLEHGYAGAVAGLDDLAAEPDALVELVLADELIAVA